MKTLILAFLFILNPADSIYQFKLKDIDGKSLNLSQFKGKKILIVNVASECGYTKQYETLQELSQKYKKQLVVIGVPANNFGGQEPGSNAEIKSFCSKNYNVTFPLTSKVSVKGGDIDPLFKWLTEQKNADFSGEIKWNFEKFLIDENGKLIRRFRSKVKPLDDELVKSL
ncbi:MAG: glutathione peroxidase [Bacteroidetes bacterium]|nr:glutathione peroxidase [Bacteroidota bacterium]